MNMQIYVLWIHECVIKTGSGLVSVNPDSKVHGANIGPIWGRQDPGGPQMSHVNLAIWEAITCANAK